MHVSFNANYAAIFEIYNHIVFIHFLMARLHGVDINQLIIVENITQHRAAETAFNL